MLVDLSHVSVNTMNDTLNTVKAPGMLAMTIVRQCKQRRHGLGEGVFILQEGGAYSVIFSRFNYLKQGHASNCFSSNNAESNEVRSKY